MDAAEIARLRELSDQRPLGTGEVYFILDALEQAQKERDKAQLVESTALKILNDNTATLELVTAQLDQAQQSAKDARALLGEADEWLTAPDDKGCDCEQCEKALALRARIEAMLEQKP